MKVAIVQPLLPHYRVPVFETLAHQPGLRLTLVADFGPEHASLEGVSHSGVFDTWHSPYERMGPFFRQDGAIAAARDPAFDVVVFEWSSRRYQLPSAVRAARRAGKGLALWGHGFGTTWPRFGNLVRNRLIELADVCILYGQTARDALVGMGYDERKFVVAPNAIDQAPIDAAVAYWHSSDRLQAFQREQGIRDKPVLLYMSRLEPEKRPAQVIEALLRVRTEHPDAQAVFIGKGRAQADLEATASRMGLLGAVRFLGPEYDEMRIAPWALSSICLVQPENLGLTIFHAFGYGLPVISCGNLMKQGPEVEALREGVNGMWYREGDVAHLSDRILTLTEDPILRGRLAEGAKRTVSGPEGRNIPTMVAGLARAIRAAADVAEARKQLTR